MRLGVEALDPESIRRGSDVGTQVRDRLNEKWVSDLADLYREGGHDIPPILVMRDKDGTNWLVDGFHRVEAAIRAPIGAIVATVRHGTLEQAKLAAAGANKNGHPLSGGEKKRAILLARETKAGREMTQTELGHHVGCTQQFVSEVLGTKNTTACIDEAGDGHSTIQSKKAAKRELRLADIRRHLDAGKTAGEIQALGFHSKDIADVRRSMGIPSKAEASEAKARQMFEVNPSLTVKAVSKEAGISQDVARRVRDEMGIPPAVGGVKSQAAKSAVSMPPSAPIRKDDPRENAEVIQLRPSTTPIAPRRFVESAWSACLQMTEDERWQFARKFCERWTDFVLGAPGERIAQ